MPALDSDSWMVLHCPSGQEQATARLTHLVLDLAVYAPELLRRVQGQPIREPFFPSYVFVQGAAAIPARVWAHLPGPPRPVRFARDMAPARLEAATLADLRVRIADYNAQGGHAPRCLQPGEVVRVRYGPFEGLEGAVDARLPSAADRVRILLDLLGGPRPVELDGRQVERVGRPAGTRGSRGVGRPIRPRGGRQDAA